ncbi:unnamed protein product [Ranitomeya imitator]|uniref:Reverse transcriptase domain-containing protein n=1 Tax=Ranitomeya imitator TaxID=111125 RepID=A0ABN9LNQ8_9NEOB|nr:unnamed protein product [Ranitomeya imitator]
MFSTFLEWVARKVTRLPSITHYLDDFLLVGPANSEVCYQALVQFKDVMSCFGVPLSPEKTIGPASVITFLGIEIDSVAMEFRLPQDKIAKLLDLIAGLILATKGVKQPHHRIRITAQLRSDLIIWQRFLFSYNGKTCFQEDECDSDSLGLRLGTVDTVGFCVSFRDQTCADTWPESWVVRAWTQDSVLMELFPLAAAMELWGQFLCNKRIRLRLKTDKAIYALNFLSSSSLPVIKVIAFTVLKCLENNTWLKANAHNSAVWSAAEGTAANPGMPSFGLGCPGELIPLLRSSIAPSTWRAYGKAWDEWCTVAAEKPVGSSDCLRLQVTLAFLARLQASGVSGAAARNCISGVAFHFKLRGWPDSTKHFLIGQAGVGPACVTTKGGPFPSLSNLVRVSGSVCDSAYEATLISAAFSLAFFGAMRVSEILPSSRCRAGGLQLEDIVICDDGLRVRRSKTDQEGRGIWFPLFAIKGSICPLALIKSYMQVRGNGPQLFIHENGSPLFVCLFLAVLRQALSFLGLPAADFGTHSFRIGAATEASRAGLFESDIQRVGRWRSRCFTSLSFVLLNNILFLVSDGMRPSIWLVGHSYIYWAARRAELCPGGRSLGLTGMDVIWRGTRGLTWSQVLPEVVRIARVASSPTVVVIHAGRNDLASFPLAELLTLMRADLDKLPGFFPVMHLVWSELIPRLVWRGARELSAMERSRRTLNQRISRFIRFKNGVVVRHHRLEGDNSGFLLPDGVHLNDADLDIFLDGLREGVVQALHSLGGS